MIKNEYGSIELPDRRWREKVFFRYVIIALLVLTILILQVHIWFEHEDRMDDVNNFMQKGDRNTAQQGYELCKRITALERSDFDCREAYFGRQQ